MRARQIAALGRRSAGMQFCAKLAGNREGHSQPWACRKTPAEKASRAKSLEQSVSCFQSLSL